MSTPLRTEREKRGWTATEVARSVKVDQSHYSKIETGKIRATAPIAERLALHFGHALTELQIIYPERYPSAPVEVEKVA